MDIVAVMCSCESDLDDICFCNAFADNVLTATACFDLHP